jgi:hypothetical protein
MTNKLQSIKKYIPILSTNKLKPAVVGSALRSGISILNVDFIDEEKEIEIIPCGHPIKFSYEAVLFFNPNAVRSFFQTNVLLEGAPCFCINDDSATTVTEYTANSILIAKEPTHESLIESVQEFFNKRKPRNEHSRNPK